MACTSEIAAEQTETFAQAARNAIDQRLSLLPDGELSDYWAIVAKLYARNLEHRASSLIDVVVTHEPIA